MGRWIALALAAALLVFAAPASGASKNVKQLDQLKEAKYATAINFLHPDDGIVWASYLHDGYVYTADHFRGVDVLKFQPGASSARKRNREVVAPAVSAKHRRFLARIATQFEVDPRTAGICFL